MKMKYLLDTSIIAFLFRKSYNIGNRLRELDSDQCYVSEITINPHPRFTAQMPVGVGSYLV